MSFLPHENRSSKAHRGGEEGQKAEAEREEEMIKKYIKARLCEASTWKGIISIAMGMGLFTCTTIQVDAIAAAMVSVYAAISTFTPDASK